MDRKNRPLRTVLAIYATCFLFRLIEYFFIQTDRSFWGEAFLHKLLGIAVLFAALRHLSLNGAAIGFSKTGAVKGALRGLAFGVAVFAVAYGAELWIAFSTGGSPSLALYVSSYSMDGNMGHQTGLAFFAICILGNLINVLMEEGIFRGLFQRLLETKYSFLVSALLSSALFGLWHVAGPLRQFYEGGSLAGALANAALLVVTTALGGFKFALLTKLTGSLYMAMGDHFVNNTIVNLLHVVSTAGADQLMFLRMSIAQTLSFAIVLAVYWKKGRRAVPAR